MNDRFSNIVTVVAAFTAGLCAGLMIAPESGRNLRRRISDEAKAQLKTAEDKLEMVESQLAKVNEQIQAAGKDLGDKVREAAQDAADELIPDLAKSAEDWDLTKDEMERELRNLSRR